MTANERVKDKDAMRAAWRAEIRQREERRAAVAPAREQETEKPWWREMTASERVKDKEAMREAWRAQSRQQEERRAAAPVRIMGREP